MSYLSSGGTCCGAGYGSYVTGAGYYGAYGLSDPNQTGGGGSIISDVKGVVTDVLDFFGSSDKAKDRIRFDRIDRALAAARAGQLTDNGVPGEQCLRGMAEVDGKGSASNILCAVGSEAAVKYAKAKWNEWRAFQGATATFPNIPAIPPGLRAAASSPIVWGLAGVALLLFATSGSSSSSRRRAGR